MVAKFHRSIGLELVGVKVDKSCWAVLDHYPDRKRLLLIELFQNPPEADIPEDLDKIDKNLIFALTERVQTEGSLTGIGIHAPLSFPPLFDLGLGKKKLPWHSQNKAPEVKWMNDVWKALDPKPKAFCPYLQRPTEIWLRYLTKDHFQISEGFGSNTAPLLARAQYLKPHLPKKLNEIFPRASLFRIALSLGMPKWIPSLYSDLEKGIEAREEFMKIFNKKCPQIFVYQRDFDLIIQNLNCFNAWICALTQHLVSRDLYERPPESYPAKSHFIKIPIKDIPWPKVF